MAIPIATTTIAVLRVPADPDRDPYEPQPEPAAIVTGVRASIATPSGREQVAGGEQEIIQFRLTCDPTDLTHTDQVRDESTGELYDVIWARLAVGLGLDHVQAGLQQISGVV